MLPLNAVQVLAWRARYYISFVLISAIIIFLFFHLWSHGSKYQKY